MFGRATNATGVEQNRGERYPFIQGSVIAVDKKEAREVKTNEEEDV